MKATDPVSPSEPPALVKAARTFGGGAVAVVGQRLDDDRHAARPIALVAHFIVVLRIAAGGLVDGALDIVLGHGLRLGVLHGEPETRVHVRVGAGRIFAATVISRASLGEHLGADRVLAALAVP